MSWNVITSSPEQYIVRVEYNDTEGAPGVCFYGPFIKEKADDFAQHWCEDDTEIGDVDVIPLNPAIKETS